MTIYRWTGSAFAAGVIGVALASLPPATAHAGGLAEAAELEAARANARAGGPTSERDKELLTRYGCLSGTDSDFCRKLEGRPENGRAVKRGTRPRAY